MIIGIDGNEANVEKRVGVGEYAFELLKQFENFKFPISRQRRGSPKAANFQFQIYLKEKPRRELPKEKDRWKYRVIGPKKLWTQIGLPFDLFLHRPRPNVFFTPTHYAPRFSPVPTVISIMDLSYIHFPQMFKKSDLYQLKNWTSYSVKKAKKVLTISQASKDDIIKAYKVPEDMVVVTYPGIKMKIRNPKSEIRKDVRRPNNIKTQNSKLKTRYGIEGEYILFVGTLQPRKNIIRLIEAFARLPYVADDAHSSLSRKQTKGRSLSERLSSKFGLKRGTDVTAFSSSASRQARRLQLVIIGKKGWMWEEILEAPKKFGVEKHVKFLDFVIEEDLPVLYQNALCFVLPSLYEGFGLPVLEAMKYGCPVITSNVSSLPEAGGEAALYVDPENVDDIASKIKLLIENEKLSQELIEKGYKQVKKFSWEKTAKETLKVLEEVVRDSK